MEEKQDKLSSCFGCGCLLFIALIVLAIVAITIFYKFGDKFEDKNELVKLRADAKTNLDKLNSTYEYFTKIDTDSLFAIDCDADYQSNKKDVLCCIITDLAKLKNDTMPNKYYNDLDFITSNEIESHLELDLKNNSDLWHNDYDIKFLKESNILAIFYIDEYYPPKSFTGNNFISGFIKGKIVIFDMIKQKAHCIVKFEAENSSTVEYKDSKLSFKDKDDYLMNDLKEHFAKEVAEKIYIVNPHIKVDPLSSDFIKKQ